MDRNHRNPQAAGDRLADGFVAAQFHARTEALAVQGEEGLGRAARARPPFAQDELFVGQIADG